LNSGRCGKQEKSERDLRWRLDCLSCLFDQPIPEPPNRSLLQRFGCRHCVVRELHWPVYRERLYQLLRPKVVLSINIPHKRQPLSRDSRTHNQVILRKRRALFAVRRGDAMGFKPKRPVLAIEVMSRGNARQSAGRLSGARFLRSSGLATTISSGATSQVWLLGRDIFPNHAGLPNQSALASDRPGGRPSPRQFQCPDNAARTSRR